MFHSSELDDLLAKLKALQLRVRATHGRHVIVSRMDTAVGDFEHQPTIWDAFDGQHTGQGWELPTDFPQLFDAWRAAHSRLAAVPPERVVELEEAVSAADLASEVLLSELYRCKDRRAGRMALAFDLFAASEEIMRQNLRRENPSASEEEIERSLDEWLRSRPAEAPQRVPASLPGRAGS